MEGFNGYVEHFDGQAFQIPDNVDVSKIDPEGWMLKNGAYQLPLADSGQRSGGSKRAGASGGGGRNGGSGSAGGRRGRAAFTQEGSILGSTGANRSKSTCGTGPRPSAASRPSTTWSERTRISASRSRSCRPARSRPGSGPDDRQAGDDLDEACETIFRPPGGLWRPKTWYHVGMSYRGCKPEEIGIWWDGMKRGEARFQSTLSGSISETDTSFSVDRADDWPQRGVCWVGREAVEYARAGTTFDAITYPAGGGNGAADAARPPARTRPARSFSYSDTRHS